MAKPLKQQKRADRSVVAPTPLVDQLEKLKNIPNSAERAYEIAQIEAATTEEDKLLVDEFWQALMG